MLKVGLIGASGNMASYLVKEIIKSDRIKLTYALVRPKNPNIGKDIGEYFNQKSLGVLFTDNKYMWDQIDAVIDFSDSDISLEIAKQCAKYKKINILGTTAINANQQILLKKYAKNCPIVFSFNMSFGINLLIDLVCQAASKLGSEYDIEILDIHHRSKKDAPSGTSLMLGEAAIKGRKVKYGNKYSGKKIFDRTYLNVARQKNDISFASIRGGASIFEHEVMFLGDNEVIKLSHKSTNRAIYAQGAIKALLWAQNKPNGLYSMKDVILSDHAE